MGDLRGPCAPIHGVAGREIFRQRQKIPNPIGNVEVALLEKVAAANSINFGDFRIDWKNLRSARSSMA